MSSLLFAIFSAAFQTHKASPEVKTCKACDSHTHTLLLYRLYRRYILSYCQDANFKLKLLILGKKIYTVHSYRLLKPEEKRKNGKFDVSLLSLKSQSTKTLLPNLCFQKINILCKYWDIYQFCRVAWAFKSQADRASAGRKKQTQAFFPLTYRSCIMQLILQIWQYFLLSPLCNTIFLRSLLLRDFYCFCTRVGLNLHVRNICYCFVTHQPPFAISSLFFAIIPQKQLHCSDNTCVPLLIFG